MTTTKETISKWFDDGVNNKQDFMIVVCDSYDYSDYPVYCLISDYEKTYKKQTTSSMQHIMEVYDLTLDKQMQLDENYAWHTPGGRKTPASIPQPPPAPGKTVVLDQVLKDIQERSDTGLRKYGVRLQTNNGRDALWDSYQEAIDLVMYLRQALLEREGK